MPRGILPEVKLQAVKDYISGNGSYLSHASKLGVSETVFRRWVNKYKASGESALALWSRESLQMNLPGRCRTFRRCVPIFTCLCRADATTH